MVFVTLFVASEMTETVCPLLVGIVIDTVGNHWVVDATCYGNLYKNRVVVTTASDDLSALQISSKNPQHTADIYVAVENICGNYGYPFVADLSEFEVLPHPYTSGSDEMAGISTLLYFTDDDTNLVFLTTDKITT